jgi:hypothetical protein
MVCSKDSSCQTAPEVPSSLFTLRAEMRENEMACRVGEGIVDEFAEGHKDRVTRLLVVWHAPPIFIFAAEGRMVGHDLLKAQIMALSVTGKHAISSLSRVERTLLSAAFDFVLVFSGLWEN